MSCKLNNTTLSLLIQEDLEWLLKQKRTLEQEHIRLILEEKIRELNGSETCSSCQINSSNEPHTCPYAEEMADNHELCNCCNECTYDCGMDI